MSITCEDIMLNLAQPLPQLRAIAEHHLKRFPNLFYAWRFTTWGPLEDVSLTELEEIHPSYFVGHIAINDWSAILSSWNRYFNQAIPYISSEALNPRFANYGWWTDVGALSYVGSHAPLFPSQVFQPVDRGPYRRDYLREGTHRRFWLCYELARLMAPQHKYIKDLSNELMLFRRRPPIWQVNHSQTWQTQERNWARLISPLILEAIDRVGVGIAGNWDPRSATSFETWYEEHRRIPRDFLQAVRLGQTTINNAPHYCAHCNLWEHRCTCSLGERAVFLGGRGGSSLDDSPTPPDGTADDFDSDGEVELDWEDDD